MTLSDENTRSKFLFYGGQNCLHPDVGLERYIPPEIIPDFLGGPCEVSEGKEGRDDNNLHFCFLTNDEIQMN